MGSEELINRYEDVSVEQIKLLREIFARYRNDEMSNEEWSRFVTIIVSTNMTTFSIWTSLFTEK